MCQNSLPSGVGRSRGAKISGESVVPGEYFLVSTKLDTVCYPKCKLHRATCRSFDTIPACDGQTDRQTDGHTDGIAVHLADWSTRGCHRRLRVLSFRSFGGICETASSPVRDLSSLRVDQSARCPVHELAIRELAYPRVVLQLPRSISSHFQH